MRSFQALIALLGYCSAYAIKQPSAISTVYQFEKGTWPENLAIGPTDDSVLVTRMDKPYLYRVNLPQDPHSNVSAEVVHTFSQFNSVLGITEYAPHAFAVITGNFSLSNFSPGNYSFWSVDFADCSQPSIKKIAALPNNQFFFNGLTTLDSGTLFTMKSDPGVIGINGLRTVTLHNGTYLYYDNSNTRTINRVPTDPVTGRATGPVTTLASGYFPDDLAYDYKTGDVYVAANKDNVLFRVSPDGSETAIAGGLNKLLVAGPSSVVFGKGKHHRTLYATTTGGTKSPINGTITTNAKLMSFEVGFL